MTFHVVLWCWSPGVSKDIQPVKAVTANARLSLVDVDYSGLTTEKLPSETEISQPQGIFYYDAPYRFKKTYLKSVISLSSWTGVKALLCFTSPSNVAVSGLFVYILPAETQKVPATHIHYTTSMRIMNILYHLLNT